VTFWELGRARGPALLGVSLACGLAILDCVVSGSVGWDTFGGSEQSQTFSRFEQASAKALALNHAARSGARVGLVVGMSTADWGIDLRQLEAAGDHLRWAKVTGEFSSFSNLLEIVRRFEHQRVQPERTLLCVHYGMLLGARRYKTTRSERVAQVIERTSKTRSSSELSRLSTLTWLGNNRAGAANVLELQLTAVRERILSSFAQPPQLIYPAIRDPFEDSSNTRKRMNPTVRERHVSNFQERWRLAQVPAASSDSEAQISALAEIVRLLGQRPGLVVVLMPEHSALRAVVPQPFAETLFKEALTRSGRGSSTTVLDIRASLPDEYFADEVHATAEGRPVLTAALERAVSGAMPAQPRP
jgi:hypothetical protein